MVFGEVDLSKEIRAVSMPELRVADDAGNYITGGAVNPMQGSFVNDTIQYRMRQFSGGALYVPDAVIWSDGSES